VILGGDIGGTKTALALFERGQPSRPVRSAAKPSHEVHDLGDVIARFVADAGSHLEAVALGAPGPVVDERVETTNLPWVLEARALSARLGGVPVFLLNDLEALAHAVLHLPADSCAVLNAGRPQATGNVAVIAAGTGLGEAGLVWDGRRHVAFASEGGHADFSPRSPREIALLRYLVERYEHVSWERLVSGPGLVHVFEFVRDVEGAPVPDALASAMRSGDPAAAIAAAALGNDVPAAAAALDLFVTLYGAEAGNLALKLKSTGGVYVGGGIGPKLRRALEAGSFLAAFVAKGRFAELLAQMPVRLVLDDHAGLYGAAAYADACLAG